MELAEVVAPARRTGFKPGEISAFALRVTDELEGSVAGRLGGSAPNVARGASMGRALSLMAKGETTLLPRAGSTSERTHLPRATKREHKFSLV
jgi:hypothetical protein